jgi:hypothetical protein
MAIFQSVLEGWFFLVLGVPFPMEHIAFPN